MAEQVEEAKDMNRRNDAVSRREAILMLAASALTLASCTHIGTSPPPRGPIATPGNPMAASGDVIGTGSVRVALLLPRSAQGNASALATSMRNAAELGLNDFRANDLTLLVKDSGGTAEAAALAANAALAEGAELIIGPVFGAEVRAVAPIALQRNIPVISFSSDPSVASGGVYIMGFLVDDQVRPIIAQAAASGRRSMAALVSDNAYGTLAEAALRQAAASQSVRLVQVERFTSANLAAKAQAIAANASQIDSIFIPDGPGIAPQVAGALAAAGIDAGRVKFLGSGQWNDPAVYTNAALVGGWFPAPEISAFQAFSGRYRTAYGAETPLTASLAYDAVVLAAGLVKAAGAQRFQRSVIANPEGFLSSVNGLFRFNADGTNDRGLALYEVTGSAPRLVQPAPRSFSGF